MNPSTSPAQPDARLDQVLNALRSTEAPAGLEARIETRVAQRIATRLAQASKARNANPSLFTVSLSAVRDPRMLLTGTALYASATTAIILAIVSLALLHPHVKTHIATTQVAQGFSLGSHRTHQRSGPLAPAPFQQLATNATQLSNPETPTIGTIQVPQGFSLGSHNNVKTARDLTPASQQPASPDTIALAETRAPSHPAPPMPLTQQELLLLQAARKGTPIELAALELANAPAFHAAAEARRDADIRRFAQNLLAPLAISESLQPTTPDTDPSPPQPAQPSSPTN